MFVRARPYWTHLALADGAVPGVDPDRRGIRDRPPELQKPRQERWRTALEPLRGYGRVFGPSPPPPGLYVGLTGRAAGSGGSDA
jgi:hypothetical protein